MLYEPKSSDLTAEKMVQEKRKSFVFEETDLEWINPLLVEWAKENEGKKQGELIAELLKDYKEKRESEQVTREMPSEAEGVNYAERVGDALSGASVKLKEGADKLQDQLRGGYKQLAENIGKLETKRRASEAIDTASEKVKSGGQQISSGLKKGYEQLLGSIKKRKEDTVEEE